MSLVARLAARLAPRVRPAAPPRALKARAELELGEALRTVELPPRQPEPLPTAGRWVSNCPARCAESGLRCRQLAGHDGAHRHERGVFLRCLPAGAVPVRRVDEAATRRIGGQTYE